LSRLFEIPVLPAKAVLRQTISDLERVPKKKVSETGERKKRKQPPRHDTYHTIRLHIHVRDLDPGLGVPVLVQQLVEDELDPVLPDVDGPPALGDGIV
jgi:hypothetical protein